MSRFIIAKGPEGHTYEYAKSSNKENSIKKGTSHGISFGTSIKMEKGAPYLNEGSLIKQLNKELALQGKPTLKTGIFLGFGRAKFLDVYNAFYDVYGPKKPPEKQEPITPQPETNKSISENIKKISLLSTDKLQKFLKEINPKDLNEDEFNFIFNVVKNRISPELFALIGLETHHLAWDGGGGYSRSIEKNRWQTSTYSGPNYESVFPRLQYALLDNDEFNNLTLNQLQSEFSFIYQRLALKKNETQKVADLPQDVLDVPLHQLTSISNEQLIKYLNEADHSKKDKYAFLLDRLGSQGFFATFSQAQIVDLLTVIDRLRQFQVIEFLTDEHYKHLDVSKLSKNLVHELFKIEEDNDVSPLHDNGLGYIVEPETARRFALLSPDQVNKIFDKLEDDRQLEYLSPEQLKHLNPEQLVRAKAHLDRATLLNVPFNQFYSKSITKEHLIKSLKDIDLSKEASDPRVIQRYQSVLDHFGKGLKFSQAEIEDLLAANDRIKCKLTVSEFLTDKHYKHLNFSKFSETLVHQLFPPSYGRWYSSFNHRIAIRFALLSSEQVNQIFDKLEDRQLAYLSPEQLKYLNPQQLARARAYLDQDTKLN